MVPAAQIPTFSTSNKGTAPLSVVLSVFWKHLILYCTYLNNPFYVKLVFSNSQLSQMQIIFPSGFFLVTYYWLWTKWHLELFFVSLEEFELVVFNSVYVHSCKDNILFLQLVSSLQNGLFPFVKNWFVGVQQADQWWPCSGLRDICWRSCGSPGVWCLQKWHSL